jgi:hypothetical protein
MLMDNLLYLYIPRDKILNYTSRIHRGDNFRKIFHYKNKKRFSFDANKIQEVDLFNVSNVQVDTFYKSCYRSSKDQYRDWFWVLKEKYNTCDEIFMESNRKYTVKDDRSYKKNRIARKKSIGEPGVPITNGKITIRFD